MLPSHSTQVQLSWLAEDTNCICAYWMKNTRVRLRPSYKASKFPTHEVFISFILLLLLSQKRWQAEVFLANTCPCLGPDIRDNSREIRWHPTLLKAGRPLSPCLFFSLTLFAIIKKKGGVVKYFDLCFWISAYHSKDLLLWNCAF